MTSVRIDTELLYKARQLNINMSGMLNNVLKGMISQYNNCEIDIFKIEEELRVIDDKISQLKIKQQELLTQKISFEENKQQENKKEIDDLVKQANFIKRSGVMEDF